jgi:hypothetical protein
MNRTNHSPAVAGRRELRRTVFGLALLALAPFGMGCASANQKAQGEEITLADLPQEVRDGLDRATVTYLTPLAGAKWDRVERLGGADDSLYRLKGTNGRDRTIELEVTRAGRVIEVEEFGVPLAEVPAAVIEGLKARIPYANPDWVVAIYQAGALLPVGYGFGGRNADGAAVKVYITADGKTFLN